MKLRLYLANALLTGCATASSQHPYAHFSWAPATITATPIRSLPLRSPFTDRLSVEERAQAAAIIARTPRPERKWLRYAFAGPGRFGDPEFVIFSTDGLPPDGTIAGGGYQVFKQLNTPSCNGGYDPVENTALAETRC